MVKRTHSTSPGLAINKCRLVYEHQTVFDEFSIELASGQWTCLLGPSGVGKSSLLKIIAGLVQPERGEVSAHDGKPVADRVSYMAQRDLLLPWLSVLDNVLLSQILRGQAKKPMQSQAMTLLDQVGLAHVASLKPQALSGGMRQRVALVRTLMADQPILLMDEPFSALDIVTRFKLHQLACQLLAAKTVLLITHDPLEAIRLSDVIYIMTGAPATLSQPVVLSGDKPREITDELSSTLYAKLVAMLAGEADA